MFKHVFAIGVIGLVLGCQSGRGGGGNDPEAPVARSVPVDQTFVADAASSGLLEVQTGQLAADRADNDELKKFGQMMVGDHTKAHARLKAAAAKDGLKVPDQLLPADQKIVERLTKLRGGEFDREYARVIVDSHEKSVASFEQEARQGKQPALKAYASETVPTLRRHLERARAIQQKIK